MKHLYCLCIIILPSITFADAGFNIGREKARCYAVFRGIDQYPGYEFLKISTNDERRNENLADSGFLIKNNDTFRIYYKEGERRYWQGPIKILTRNKATGQIVDSFVIVAEGYNLTVNYNGSRDGKPQYAISKSKAEYPYVLFGDEEPDASAARRNKYIFIAMSVIGFVLLFFMLFKKRNNTETKTA